MKCKKCGIEDEKRRIKGMCSRCYHQDLKIRKGVKTARRGKIYKCNDKKCNAKFKMIGAGQHGTLHCPKCGGQVSNLHIEWKMRTVRKGDGE